MTTAPETQTDQRVSISRNGGSFLLRVSFLSTPLIEREKRVAESKGLLRRVAQEGHGFEVPDAGDVMLFRFDHVDEAWILRASRRLEQHISAILTAPLSPKAVERALAITSRERIRWYKDGRLPICGRAPVGKGNHRMQVPLFAFETNVQLQSMPQVIEGWRREDGGAETGTVSANNES